MRSDLDKLLLAMHKIVLGQACRIPTPAEPVSDEWEQAADSYCLRFSETLKAEMPSPEIACALVPRLKFARLFASTVEHQLSAQAGLTGDSAKESEILRGLLVELWHSTWKGYWLAGKFEQ